jgi:shikimate kinase
LPGSGKTTLSRQLAPALALSLLDKDDILEGLFETLGIGDADWRQRLSRASDEILERMAWRNPAISTDSGTPTDWITATSSCVVEVYCLCDPETAAARFLDRVRHPGHLESAKPYEEVLASLRALSAFGPLGIGEVLQVDTCNEANLETVVGKVKALLGADGRQAIIQSQVPPYEI